MESLFVRVLTLSLTGSAVLLPLLLLAPRLRGRYAAGTLSVLWLVLALRMALPVPLSLPWTAVTVDVSALRRTEAAGFSLAEAVPLEALLDAPDPAALLRPVDAYFFRYPAVTVEGTALRKAKNGNPFPCSAADGDWRVYLS